MKRLQNKTNVTAPNAQFPYGAVKDNTGTNNGTPVNVDTYGDMHQFFEKLFAESGLPANGLPDDATNGFQLYQALITAGNYAFAQDVIKGLIGSYTTNDLIVLWGCTVSATIPGSSTITTGAIFYNGIIYKVPAATVVTISGETLVFKINATVQPGTIYLTNGTAGSGIANYNQSSVKLLSSKLTTETINGTQDTFSSTSYVDMAGMTYTTPNDGVTRRYLITFTADAFSEVGPTETSRMDAKIYNATDSVDFGTAWHYLNAGSIADVVDFGSTMSFSIVKTIAPNKTIKVAGKRTTASSYNPSVRNKTLTISEI
jgi:hypothetical protein